MKNPIDRPTITVRQTPTLNVITANMSRYPAPTLMPNRMEFIKFSATLMASSWPSVAMAVTFVGAITEVGNVDLLVCLLFFFINAALQVANHSWKRDSASSATNVKE